MRVHEKKPEVPKATNRCKYVDGLGKPCNTLTYNRWWCRKHHGELSDRAGLEWECPPHGFGG